MLKRKAKSRRKKKKLAMEKFDAIVFEHCGFPMCRNEILPGTVLELASGKFHQGDRVRVTVQQYLPEDRIREATAEYERNAELLLSRRVRKIICN